MKIEDSTTATRSGLHALVFGPGGAATFAGFCEIMIFHPFDTVSKRLMSHNKPVVIPGNISATMSNTHSVIFGGMNSAVGGVPHTGAMAHVKHLYPGSSYAIYYKVTQRFIKFAGQPYMRDYLYRSPVMNAAFTKNSAFGERKGKMLLEATAGCIVGASEVVLLPIDRMKVLSQTNKAALAGRPMYRIVADVGITKMYAGIGTTVTRNIVGSFMLFGGAALTKEYAFGLENYRKATFAQDVVASLVGACLGVICTSPMDVIKTRLQSQKFAAVGEAKPLTGFGMAMRTVKHEGPQAFFKGLTPKVATSAPRLVFSFTVSQYVCAKLRVFGDTIGTK